MLVRVALPEFFVATILAVVTRQITVVIIKFVALRIKFVVTEFAVLRGNSVKMASVKTAIQSAIPMKYVVVAIALGGNVAIAQMHVHNSKHVPMVFVVVQ